MKTLFSPLQEFLKKGDMLLLSLCLLASGFGVALIFSATRYNDNNKEVAVQIVAILLGILVYILCTYVDFESFVEKNWKWLLGFSIIFLLLLLTPFGVTRGGKPQLAAVSRLPHSDPAQRSCKNPLYSASGHADP